MRNDEILKLMEDFWKDEVIATELYDFLSKKVSGDKSKLFKEISEMERRHAIIWNEVCEKAFSVKFKLGIRLRIKKFFMKLLAAIMPLTFMVYYLESDERSAVLNYSKLLKEFKDDPQLYSIIEGVIKDEIDHEARLIDMVLEEVSYINKAKDAIYGMTDSLVEILALVIGLAGVMKNPILIGLAGLISSIGGTFSMTSGAYLSTKSQNDIYEGKIKEIDVKEAIDIDSLKNDLKSALIEKGTESSAAEGIIRIIGNDSKVLKNLVRSLSIEETLSNPKDVAVTTGIYYILGAMPAVIPFFAAYALSMDSLTAVIISVMSAAIVSFFSGIFIAVLSGISIKKKAFENVLIIMGAAVATYFIGTAARVFLGIEI
ncbi:MAG: VIT1/CCC1 transporter family protein [Candidatus Odinarchaeota archaeon]|nr:VIT1/CCC1 transporter family protein [Candidatus Odinarchaeota archaeon]